jgi:hypothetical protein
MVAVLGAMPAASPLRTLVGNTPTVTKLDSLLEPHQGGTVWLTCWGFVVDDALLHIGVFTYTTTYRKA